MKFLFKIFASLRLTIILLGLGMVLIFVGTLDQVNLGTHAAQKKYFESFFLYWSPGGSSWKIPVLPGGVLLCSTLLINLLVAHFTRFKMTWKKSGIFFVHLGILLMLGGMLLTSMLSVESQMTIDTGDTKNYSENTEEVELAIINTSDPTFDEVVSIPEEILLQKREIQTPKLPFRVKIKDCFPNSALTMRKSEDKDPMIANQGMGSQLKVQSLPMTYKPNEQNILSTYVEFVATSGSLGTWLLSKGLGRPQNLSYENKTYELEIRPKRYYKPYTLTLKEFKHDIYPGTDIPKNFSSQVQLKNKDEHEDREVLIYMNHPLRYGGETYYQASFANDDKTTILQVVRNPSWLTPYFSCLLIAIGLIVQFSIHLSGFLKRREV
jgi:hypothetical protein